MGHQCFAFGGIMPKCEVCAEGEGKCVNMSKGLLKNVLGMEGSSVILCKTCHETVLQLISNYLKGLSK